MMAARSLRTQVVDISRALAERGWVANHDGNITVRLGPDRILATPTATAKRLVDHSLLIEVDTQGQRVSGTARPFGELGLHLGIYQSRDDVNAVVHAHPPHATAIACSAKNPIEQPFIAEAVVSIGPRIPKLPFAMPGDHARRALVAVTQDVDAALMQSHGVIAWGADLEQAYLRLELVEHLARVALLAQPLGGVTPLPDSAMAPLLDKRARAGLGKAADRAPDLHTAGGPSDSPQVGPAGRVAQPAQADQAELQRVIREELIRALGK